MHPCGGMASHSQRSRAFLIRTTPSRFTSTRTCSPCYTYVMLPPHQPSLIQNLLRTSANQLRIFSAPSDPNSSNPPDTQPPNTQYPSQWRNMGLPTHRNVVLHVARYRRSNQSPSRIYRRSVEVLQLCTRTICRRLSPTRRRMTMLTS